MKATHAGWMLVVWLLAAPVLHGGDVPLPPATVVPDQATLEKRFEEKMAGITLAGFFTVTGKVDDKPLKEEKYTITKVTKLREGFWLFSARIQYGKHDVNLGLPLEVKWAGDTPVITLTNYPVPGFGTFTCRILLYDDKYAGTWSGGNHGGSMFGRLMPSDDPDKSEADSDD
ncbi:MAG TPA: hypothetical protein VHY20_01970 [Pirellulales bacterium]|jgi:hypothetical protein|nr:hypothetical protein [Pirellulales bacterium]